MVYGYARISTAKQDITRQVRNILTVDSAAKIYQEVFTGTKTTGRNELKKLLKAVKSGDVIIFDSVSRMSRNADEGYEVYMNLYEQGVDLMFLNEPYVDTKFFREKLKYSIGKVETGDKKTDKLINAVSDALTEYTKELAKESIRIAFEQAQKEVDDLSERTKQGLVTAKLNGKTLGRVKGAKVNTKKSDACKKKILQHSKAFGGTLSDKDLIAMLGIDKNTYYKYKKELMRDSN